MYKLDEQEITNTIRRYVKLTEQPKQIKLFIYYTNFKMSKLIGENNTNSWKTLEHQTNVVYKFTCPFRECLLENER